MPVITKKGTRSIVIGLIGFGVLLFIKELSGAEIFQKDTTTIVFSCLFFFIYKTLLPHYIADYNDQIESIRKSKQLKQPVKHVKQSPA